MDPIAFFDHLAANSITSQSSRTESNDDRDSYNKHQLATNLDTIKPTISIAEGEQGFQDKWSEFVKAYRSEKQALEDHLKEQLRALAQVEDHYDKANVDIHHHVQDSFHHLQKDLEHYHDHINAEKKQFEQERRLIKEIRKFQEEKIKLNVGGQLFETSLTTLRKDPNSMLSKMFSEGSTIKPDVDNSYFIDRDSTYFRLVLNYLRDLKIPAGVVDDPKIMDELMQEARFYQINDLLKQKWSNLPVITQEQLHKLYPPNPQNTQFRPIIMQLTKKNLSNLDFSNYHIDPRSSFADSNLEGANFSKAKFGFDFDHQVDFSYTFLVHATFPAEGTTNRASGVQFKLEGALLEI